MKITDILACPICKKLLSHSNRSNSLICPQNHTFDFSKSGYVNLLWEPRKSSPHPGDSPEMVKARTFFLNTGSYSAFCEKINAIVSSLPHDIIVDAGCGDGYYDNNIAPDAMLCGFDLSKAACEHAAKTARKKSLNRFFAVAGLYNMPLIDHCADILLNLFAPCAKDEFARIQKDGGYLLMGVAGQNHLIELKKAIYEDVYFNEIRRDILPGYILTDVQNIRYQFYVKSSEEIQALFSMTPYYWKTSVEDSAKLKSISSLEITADFDLLVYQYKDTSCQ